jgi:cytochrome c
MGLPRFILAMSLYASSLVVSPFALAQQTGEELLRSKACLGCHQVDAKRLGPSFTLVAHRYGAVDGGQDYLALVIRQGSRGRWGAVPMPAQPQVSEQDANAIAQWILTLVEPQGKQERQ